MNLAPEIQNVFGTLTTPQAKFYTAEVVGIILLLNNVLKISIVVSGLYALINLLSAGIQYIGSSGNPEQIKVASSKIWISLLGLVIIASSFVLAALIGLIFFKDPKAIILPTVYGPTP